MLSLTQNICSESPIKGTDNCSMYVSENVKIKNSFLPKIE